jgi:hypothetical protein
LACSPETWFEALDANDWEEEPEEADKECDIDQQRRSLFQTTKNNLEQY